jgi:O-antigen/teichoic acid export membrane protein
MDMDGSAEHSFLLRLLPARLRDQLGGRHELRRALVNIHWLLLQTVFDGLLGITVGIWVARHLAPERYGVLSYSVAFAGLLAPLATLGLGSIVVRNLVRDEPSAPATLGTATALRAAAGVALVAATIATVAAVRPGDREMLLYCAIAAAGLAIKNLAAVELWFQAKVQAKFVTLARVGSGVLTSAIKVALILAGGSLLAFVIAFAAHLALPTLALLILYTATTGVSPLRWRVRKDVARELLSDSWPLIFAGLMSTIYMKIDQVMLGEMQGEAAVGIYAAAVRLSEAFYIVPSLVVVSVFPSLVKARELGRELYLERFQRLYDGFVWMALLAGAAMQLCSGWLVQLLYGPAFAAAAPVLAAHIWSGVFWYSGSAGHRYLIAENQTKVTLAMTTLGALANTLLNLLLIPRFGALGAAYATLISFAISHCFSAALFAPSRIMLLLFARAFDPAGLSRRWRPLLRAAGLLR